jgi:tRNA nucleotidyltransferase (CCA-adding enzyme)
VLRVAHAVAEAGGRALVVGGWVRDRLLGEPGGDRDVELYGLDARAAEALLARFGRVRRVGRAFPVLRVSGIDADWSLPRRDSASRRELESADPTLAFAEAARRRDLRVNSMAWDPLSAELLDPFGGRVDLETRRLRATDPVHFGEDPLRALRVATLRARFGLEPDAELLCLCAGLDLDGLPGERVGAELGKLLACPRPSTGFAFLRAAGLLRFLPELEELVAVPQDPEWHPEGPVFDHTLLALDAAAGLRDGDPFRDEALLWGTLCHDLGKPAATVRGADGRVRSPRHEVVGAELALAWLGRLRASQALAAAVTALVRHHLAPAQLAGQGAGPGAYRRLARRLAPAGVSLSLLERVARADHLGRTTADARAGRFPAGDAFLARAGALALEEQSEPPAVLGRHVLARGVVPGPEVGRILARCRAVQDETGWRDPDRILARVLGAE